jgi:4-hydroxy-3-methylbut-2-enyl diphosphate reductase
MEVKIDPHSGFCFGVVYAIQMAEDELNESGKLFCLGDIVHNSEEVDRLKAKGLEIIDHERLHKLRDCKVLIRAHGEPPETYRIAAENNIELIDASCPVVLKLQHRVREGYIETDDEGGQVVIYGKQGHAEVNGLIGQTDGKAIVVMEENDLDKIDFRKPIQLFSQTTKSTKGFFKIKGEIEKRLREAGSEPGDIFEANDTLCRQVSNREPQLRSFAPQFDVVIFVSGQKSSNGKILYEVCKEVNPRTHFVSSKEEIEKIWFEGAGKVGICGATSTPMWLMEAVKERITQLSSSH